ncbi:YebC/PmpR family DNA-binding transcriptional regulator [Candidatus Sumerlaeota bacterium]|nr:YebC/PmpR family DNA-binding transcriptional regulator [Candidatus Sumerlaeota bacterium]
MSGHSKWHSIRHKKAAVDAKRGKLFTKLIREITIAARTGGGDPDSNPRLRTAIQAARAANMPKENIERAIKRGTGELPGINYEDLYLEGYGPGGVALFIEATTDNRKRTISEIRHIFTRHNANLGEAGCVSWMFTRKGVILVSAEQVDEDKLMEIALEAGADDLINNGDSFTIYTEPAQLESVRAALEEKGISIESAEISFVPNTTVKVEGKDAESLLKLLNALEEHDEVQSVAANFEMSDALLEQLS